MSIESQLHDQETDKISILSMQNRKKKKVRNQL